MSEKDKGSFWNSVPGILTGIAAIITAITGLYIALNNNGTQDTKIKPPSETAPETGNVKPPITNIPNPQLVLRNTTHDEIRGRKFYRYHLSITNSAQYPSELFASSPDLAPCGNNTNASRTWVNIYNAENNGYLYGYCALSSPQELDRLSFAIEEGKAQPKSVYVELKDRRDNVIYRSHEVSIR